MVLFKPEDFYDLGSAGGDFVKGAAKNISDRVCSLYQNHPTGFISGNPLAEGLDGFNRGVWDSFCGNLPEPKLPTVNPGGSTPGACDGVVYLFRVQLVNTDGTDGAILGGGFGSDPFAYWGPVGGVRYELTPDGTGSIIYLTSRGSAGGSILPSEERVFTNTSPVSGVRLIELRRQDGQPDNCGSTGPSYDMTPPPSSNPGTYTHVNGDGTTSSLNYDITFSPDIRGPLVRLPDIPNVCLSFSAFGLDFDFCSNKPGEGTGGDISDILERLKELEDRLDDIGDQVDELNNDEPLNEGPAEPLEDEDGNPLSATVNCVQKLRFVKVQLTKIPPSANIEKGLGGSDLVQDAGWLAFQVGSYLLPPERIRAIDSAFEAPEGVECYALKLNFGFEAEVSHVVASDEE